MHVAASCPSCGALLGETAVLALAPVCDHCGAVITSIGGTLGLTGAYGVSDLTITRRRVEADLAIFREYQEKYEGMRQACIQQLAWGVERYAQLPLPPELLKLQPVPPERMEMGMLVAALWFVPLLIIAKIVVWGFPILVSIFLFIFFSIFGSGWHLIHPSSYVLSEKAGNFVFYLIVIGGCVVCFLSCGLYSHIRARIANGEMPLENARRQEVYDTAVAAALKVAKPLKAAQDHRLRAQIRELESLAKTVEEKEADVRRLLVTL